MRRVLAVIALTGGVVWLLTSPLGPTLGLTAGVHDQRCAGIPLGPTAITAEDGALPRNASPWDDGLPGISNLDGELLQALREAATQAAMGGLEIHVTSGWRSREHQDQLLCEAVHEHGSEAEAARWVATADTSLHVTGDAVDIGPVDASIWLAAHGYLFGLCRVYRNEPWHFELRPMAPESGCPGLYRDPTEDPRLRRTGAHGSSWSQSAASQVA